MADDATAARALTAVRVHLADDGARITFTVTSSTTDHDARVQETTTRYERFGRSGQEVDERAWILHWHTQAGFRQLAADAGLQTVAVLGADGAPAGEAATAFAFWLAPTT